MILGVTGHRLHMVSKLNPFWDRERAKEELLELAVEQLQQLNPELVLTGLALGWDTAIAQACYKLKIPFIACILIHQYMYWYEEDRATFFDLEAKAKQVKHFGYAVYKENYLKRDRYIVDNSDDILALWSGTPYGGTAYTVRYAEKRGKKIHNCWRKWEVRLFGI